MKESIVYNGSNFGDVLRSIDYKGKIGENYNTNLPHQFLWMGINGKCFPIQYGQYLIKEGDHNYSLGGMPKYMEGVENFSHITSNMKLSNT